jgi:hypothetical protein
VTTVAESALARLAQPADLGRAADPRAFAQRSGGRSARYGGKHVPRQCSPSGRLQSLTLAAGAPVLVTLDLQPIALQREMPTRRSPRWSRKGASWWPPLTAECRSGATIT